MNVAAVSMAKHLGLGHERGAVGRSRRGWRAAMAKAIRGSSQSRV